MSLLLRVNGVKKEFGENRMDEFQEAVKESLQPGIPVSISYSEINTHGFISISKSKSLFISNGEIDEEMLFGTQGEKFGIYWHGNMENLYLRDIEKCGDNKKRFFGIILPYRHNGISYTRDPPFGNRSVTVAPYISGSTKSVSIGEGLKRRYSGAFDEIIGSN